MPKYNGWDLPSPPPEFYTFRYSMVVAWITEDGEVSAGFWYNNDPFIYDTTNNIVTNPTGSLWKAYYGDEWIDSVASDNPSLDPNRVVWCNKDILDDTGKVFLPGSYIDFGFCLRSWLTGYLLGVSGMPLPIKYEPTAPVPSSLLLSSDGYILQDVNGQNLIPKESK